MADQVPSNAEIQRTAEGLKKEIEVTKMETEGLTGVGEKLLDDAAMVIDSAEKLVLEKNKGDKLQKLAKEGEKATEELKEQAERLKRMQTETLNQIDSDRIKDLATRLLETARLAGMEIMSSPSFRKEVNDLVSLLGDILTDSVQDVGTSSSMELEGTKLKERAKGAAKDIKESRSLGEAKQKAEKAAGQAQAEAQEFAGRAQAKAQKVAGEIQQRAEKPAQRLARGEGEQSENIKETVEGAVNPVLESAGVSKRVKLSKAKLDDLWDRFVTLMREITQRERSKRVFNGLLELLRLVRDQATEVAEQTGEQVQELSDELRNSNHLRRTLELARELFESFTNKKLDKLIDHTNAVITIVNKDPQVRAYFDDLRGYMGRIMERPELLNDDAAIREGRRLIKRGRELQDKKIYGHISAINSELRDLVHAVEQDPATIRLRESMKKMVSDLMLDSSGNFVYKPEVLDQLKVIIVNSIVERLRVPLPTISVEGEDLDFEVSGLVLNVSDVIPERVLIESRGKVLLDPKQMEIEGAAHGLRITMNNINIHMPDARLWFRRKSFPKVEDEGRAAIDIGGRGMDLIITLRTLAKPPNFFRVQQVECNVHNLALSLSDTRHDFLYNSLLKLFSGTVKSDIESAIEDNIRGNLEQLNLLLKSQWEKAQLSGQPLQESLRAGVEKVQKTIGTVV
jgi:F0F1-type ATP synthase membrane subunit b/b'